jgi:hypothetical protein
MILPIIAPYQVLERSSGKSCHITFLISLPAITEIQFTLLPDLDAACFRDETDLAPGVLLRESLALTDLVWGELYVTCVDTTDDLFAELTGDGLGALLKEFKLDWRQQFQCTNRVVKVKWNESLTIF